MPVVVEEKFDSRVSVVGANPSVELRYIVFGTNNDLTAKSELADESPDEYDGLPRQSIQIEPLANDIWDGTVRYGSAESTPPQTGESSFAFETGGGTQHITHSKSTVGIFAPSGIVAPNFQGAIGVTDNGVDGVDITVPVYHFSETHFIAASAVTAGYKATLFFLTGKVNNGNFKGFASGECLFLGASGAKRGNEDWEISFRFAGSPNVTGLAVGPITGIAKKGWEYLWVRYSEVEDTSAKVLVKRPVAAYVERVYDLGNFAGLGIGT
ncbi:MAG: hypothetical protein L0219_13810 [Phycisphaerales bacterium]|nr:hypothetical protein [Phycisphaerales bacterium]